MKTHLTFLHLSRMHRLTNKFLTVIFIITIIVTSMTLPMIIKANDVYYNYGPGAVLKPEVLIGPQVSYEDITVRMGFECANFIIQDKSSNILFEVVNGEIIQHNTTRFTYIGLEKLPYCGTGGILSDLLDITGDINMSITCTSSGQFNISVYPETYAKTVRPMYNSYSVIPGTVITISDDGINAKSPTTKLSWEKVETAERYAILLKRRDLGYVIEGGKPFTNTKKTNYTVRREEGKTYQIWAQRKVKGEWRTVKTIEIAVSDDEVSVDSRPATKLHWKKVKEAERYAVLEKHHFENRYPIGGIPFTYTQKTSCTVRDEEGKTFQIRAQKKVKGKWKTIKTINITL